jgi:hypothetical protein
VSSLEDTNEGAYELYPPDEVSQSFEPARHAMAHVGGWHAARAVRVLISSSSALSGTVHPPDEVRNSF